MPTIEEYCNSLGIKDKNDLSDEQIIEWGRYWSPDISGFNEVFSLGTDLDKKNAVAMMRTAINSNKRLRCCLIMHEYADDEFIEALDRSRNFALWLD